MFNGTSKNKQSYFNTRNVLRYHQRNISPILTPNKNYIENYQNQNNTNRMCFHSKLQNLLRILIITTNLYPLLLFQIIGY